MAQDSIEAARWLQKAAEQGEITAFMMLGRMHADGEGVPQDYAVAAELYSQSAGMGEPMSQYSLALMYIEGQGVPVDSTIAVKWLRKSAERGFASAQRNLALMYADGDGAPQDFVEAHMWLSLAYKHGDSAAITIRDHIVTRMDDAQLDEAERLLREWQPNQRAYLKVPRVKANFFRGANALDTGDYDTALRDFRLLAGRGDADAQALLGYMYIEGLGVAQNNSEAAKWSLEAARQGNELAQLNMGDLYASGQGVEQDFSEAAHWLHLSAEQGIPPAQMRLSILYARGLGVARNLVRALMWANLAASHGDEVAVANRDQIAEIVSPEQIAEAQRLATEWKPRK